jgi:hypothetical protein
VAAEIAEELAVLTGKLLDAQTLLLKDANHTFDNEEAKVAEAVVNFLQST